MKARVIFFSMLLCTLFAGCSNDDENFTVSRLSVYGQWTFKEVNVDGTWIDAKKAKQSNEFLLTEDGYWVPASEPQQYKIEGNTVQCYDKEGKTIILMIRFESLSGNTATATVSWLSSGKSIEARMERDISPYYCKAPSSYLIGTWDIQGSTSGGTVTFDSGYVEIRDGDFNLKASYGRDPLWASMTIIYAMNGDYWEKRSPFFYVKNVDLDAVPNTIAISGSYGSKTYGDMYFSCKRR